MHYRISNGKVFDFCYLSVTRTVYAFVTHFVVAYIRPETNFTTRIEFSVTLEISLQDSTPRIQSMTPLREIHSTAAGTPWQRSEKFINAPGTKCRFCVKNFEFIHYYKGGGGNGY